MPSTESIKEIDTRHKVIFLSNHLRIFFLYTCPVCRRYTIHGPRFDIQGYCFMDHKRVPVYQKAFDGHDVFIGTQAVDKCFIAGNHPTANIETTRTVIRVK